MSNKYFELMDHLEEQKKIAENREHDSALAAIEEIIKLESCGSFKFSPQMWDRIIAKYHHILIDEDYATINKHKGRKLTQ